MFLASGHGFVSGQLEEFVVHNYADGAAPIPGGVQELLDVALSALGWVISHRVGLNDLRSLFSPK